MSLTGHSRVQAFREFYHKYKNKQDDHFHQKPYRRDPIKPLYKMSAEERMRATFNTNKLINLRNKKYSKKKPKKKKYRLVNNEIYEVIKNTPAEKSNERQQNKCELDLSVERGIEIKNNNNDKVKEQQANNKTCDSVKKQKAGINYILNETPKKDDVKNEDTLCEENETSKQEKKSKRMSNIDQISSEINNIECNFTNIETNDVKSKKKMKVKKEIENSDIETHIEGEQRKKKKKRNLDNAIEVQENIGSSTKKDTDCYLNKVEISEDGIERKRKMKKCKLDDATEVQENIDSSATKDTDFNLNIVEITEEGIERKRKNKKRKLNDATEVQENIDSSTTEDTHCNVNTEISEEGIERKRKKKKRNLDNAKEEQENIDSSTTKDTDCNLNTVEINESGIERKKKKKRRLEDAIKVQEHIDSSTTKNTECNLNTVEISEEGTERKRKKKKSKKDHDSNLNENVEEGEHKEILCKESMNDPLDAKSSLQLVTNEYFETNLKQGKKKRTCVNVEKNNANKAPHKNEVSETNASKNNTMKIVNRELKIDETIEIIYTAGIPVSKDDAKQIIKKKDLLFKQKVPIKDTYKILKMIITSAEKKLIKQKNKACYKCRRLGHSSSQCQKEMETKKRICSKCGSGKHSTKNCKLQSDDYINAECPVCLGKGHIAKQCFYKEIVNLKL